MTIRSGGRPRDRRQPNGRRFDPDAYATDYVPEAYEPSRRGGNGDGGGRRGGPGGSGLSGVVKFLVFALVAAGVAYYSYQRKLQRQREMGSLAFGQRLDFSIDDPFDTLGARERRRRGHEPGVDLVETAARRGARSAHGSRSHQGDRH